MTDAPFTETHRWQQTALQHHCRLAVETAHPRFSRWLNGKLVSLVLTVNSGYE